MKPVYLTHPVHGVHVAYHDHEVARCEAEGWTVRRGEAAQQPAAPHHAARRTPLKLPRRESLK